MLKLQADSQSPDWAPPSCEYLDAKSSPSKESYASSSMAGPTPLSVSLP